MVVYESFHDLPGADGSEQNIQQKTKLIDVQTLNVAATKSIGSLPDSTYRFEILPDKESGAINVVGVDVKATPEQTDVAFFVAEESASKSGLRKMVFWDESEARKMTEALTVKCRIEKNGNNHGNNS